jgi:hypothetical protein
MRFKREGGRAGVIKYVSGDQAGELEWEMLVGPFDLVIYGASCRWLRPESRALTKTEVLALAQEISDEWSVRIDAAFSDGSEDVRPRGAV